GLAAVGARLERAAQRFPAVLCGPIAVRTGAGFIVPTVSTGRAPAETGGYVSLTEEGGDTRDDRDGGDGRPRLGSEGDKSARRPSWLPTEREGNPDGAEVRSEP